MKKLIVLALAAMVASGAFAQHIFDMYFLAYANGEQNWTGFGPESSPVDLGSLYSLTLGAQAKTFKADDQSVVMHYSFVDGTTEMGWNDIELNWDTNFDNDSKSQWVTGGTGNWDSPVQSQISLAGLEDNKEYKLYVYFSGNNAGYGNYGATADNAGNGNFAAKFTKIADPTSVPEPATMSLLGLGALAMVLRRKLRK